jgi:AcrR family transcriptional regulator
MARRSADKAAPDKPDSWLVGRPSADAAGGGARTRRGPGRPPASDGATTRARILDGARSRFAQDGFEVTTLAQIASESGVTPGTIYHYFDSKPALFVAVGEAVGRTFFERFRDDVVSPTDMASMLRSLVGTFRELAASDPTTAGFIAVWATEVSRHDEIRALVGGDGLTGAVDHYRLLAREALEAGRLASGVDAEMVAGVSVALLFGLAVLVQVGHDHDLTPAACEGFTRLIDGELFG